MQMLADDAELVPRSQADLGAEMQAAAGRHGDPVKAVESDPGIRRRELFRIAAGDLLGMSDVLVVGDALTDLASATIDATLEIARRASDAAEVPEIAVIGMGRWGGRELSYASDADAMFVMEDSEPGAPDRTKIAGTVISELRRLLTRPSADPPLSLDADLRPEGKGGALIRTLSAYRNYYSRWSSTWEMQALVRADAMAGNRRSPQQLMGLIDAKRWPEGGLSPAQLHEIRRLKARVEAERLPRGANPAKHTKLGPGWAGRHRVDGADAPAAARPRACRPCGPPAPSRRSAWPSRPGLLDAQDAGHLEAAWLLASQIRNQIMLVRGRGSDSLPERQPGAGRAGRADGVRAGGVLAPAGRLPPGHPPGPRAWSSGCSGDSPRVISGPTEADSPQTGAGHPPRTDACGPPAGQP